MNPWIYSADGRYPTLGDFSYPSVLNINQDRLILRSEIVCHKCRARVDVSEKNPMDVVEPPCSCGAGHLQTIQTVIGVRVEEEAP